MFCVFLFMQYYTHTYIKKIHESSIINNDIKEHLEETATGFADVHEMESHILMGKVKFGIVSLDGAKAISKGVPFFLLKKNGAPF